MSNTVTLTKNLTATFLFFLNPKTNFLLTLTWTKIRSPVRVCGCVSVLKKVKTQFKIEKSSSEGAEQFSSKFEKELTFPRPGSVKAEESLFSSKKWRYRVRLRSQKFRCGYTVSLVSWHTPKRIHEAVFVPSQVLFVSTSRRATDGCANSLYFFITKQVRHKRVCQLSLFFCQQAGVPPMFLPTQYFFHLNGLNRIVPGLTHACARAYAQYAQCAYLYVQCAY